MYVNGEEFLLSISPIFKRRYTHDGDLLLGCTIGCQFCYYRWINASRDYIGTGKLKRLATPEEMVEFLKESKLFLPTDIIILGARGDASMYPHEVKRFLELISGDKYFSRNIVLALHRPPPSKTITECFDHPHFRFGTTITPRARELGWTRVSEESQIEGIRTLIEVGIPHHKISIEVGPLNSLNFEHGMKVIERLREIGMKHVVVRGAAFGSFGVDRESELKKMIELGFIEPEMLKHRTSHEYYVVKNFLTEKAYEYIRSLFPDMTIHRYTYTLYEHVWGVPIAYNRENKVRVSKPATLSEKTVRETVEKYGLEVVDVERRSDHYYVKLGGVQPATEDIAMTVGAELRTAVVFDKFRHTTSISDVVFYYKNSLFKPVRDWQKLLGYTGSGESELAHA